MKVKKTSVIITFVEFERPLKFRADGSTMRGVARALGERNPHSMIIFVDIALSLDRFFGLCDGHFIQVWAACATRSRAREEAAPLAQTKPFGRAAATVGASVARMRGRKLATTHALADFADAQLKKNARKRRKT